MRLNLGCGLHSLPGWVNVDAVAVPGVDITHDLDVFPWPFKDQEATEVRAFDVFEHVDDPLGFMYECWRVLQPGGLLNLHTSYWKSENSFTDPTHKRFCTERTWDYWIPGTGYHDRYGPMYARGASFAKVEIRLDGGTELDVTLRRL